MRRKLLSISLFLIVGIFVILNHKYVSSVGGGLNTQRVSTTDTEVEGLGSSTTPNISDDGRYVVFGSNAYNLVTPDTNGGVDAYIKDLVTRQVRYVGVDSNGIQGNSANYSPFISGNNRYVTFTSTSTNLIIGDTNAVADVFVRDLFTNTTIRVSVDSLGNQVNGVSTSAGISADGRYVLFQSDATNLVIGDTNAQRDVFVHDQQTGITTRVNIDSLGNQATGGSSTAQAISRDGRYVVYYSAATNLVVGDTNNQSDVFRFDRQTGTTIRVSVADDESEATGGTSTVGTISDNGQYVGFRSVATNLVLNDTNAKADAFVRDTVNGTTTRVSLSSSGVEGDGNVNTLTVSLSGDGRYVLFSSAATNMVAGDTNSLSDLFLHDRLSSQTRLVSTNASAALANGSTTSGTLNISGQYATYTSSASNLIVGDTNGYADIFVTTIDMPNCSVISPNSGIVGTNNLSVSITGGGYYPTPTIIFGSGVTVNSVTYSSGTQLTADVSIAAEATLGSRDITITNPNGDAVTCTAAFTVNPVPTVTPTPTATPIPTVTPVPTATPIPTTTPALSPVLTPTPSNLFITVTKIGNLNTKEGVTTYYYTNGRDVTMRGTTTPTTKVTGKILGTNYQCETVSDSNGIYTCTFIGELDSGTYNIVLAAENDSGNVVQHAQLTLGINTGLAQTGSPAFRAILLGIVTILGLVVGRSFVFLRRIG